MSRLKGEQDNFGWYVGALLVVTVGTVGLLEYFDFINFIPRFGWEETYGFHRNELLNIQAIAQDIDEQIEV